MAAAKIVNPIADGRIPYLQGKPEDEYLPPVYEEADRVMSRGVADNATSEQIDQARLKAAEANLEVQKKTGDYQGAAIDVALLPLNIVTMGSGKLATTGGIKSFRLASGEAVKLALKEAGKEAGKVTLKQGAKNSGKALATDFAIDTAIEETSHGAINAANLGARPTDGFGTMLVRTKFPDIIAPNTVDIATQEYAKIAVPLAVQEGMPDAVAKLVPNKKGKIVTSDELLQALDWDQNHILTPEDAAKVRDIIGNEAAANDFLNTLRKDHGITFENQQLLFPNTEPYSKVDQQKPQPFTNSDDGKQKGLFAKLWDAIVDVYNKVVGFSPRLEVSTPQENQDNAPHTPLAQTPEQPQEPNSGLSADINKKPAIRRYGHE